jgi:hypothetical protein
MWCQDTMKERVDLWAMRFQNWKYILDICNKTDGYLAETAGIAQDNMNIR